MEPNPHDALFRGIFGQPEHAAAELREVLPPAIAAELDLVTLAPLPATFIDAALAERHADLLFEVARRGGGSALVLVLVEHQSGRDSWMLLRLLGYQVRIWEQWRRLHPEASQLPAIVPIVVHHGAREWSVPRSFEELFALTAAERDAFAPHLVTFSAVVDDLTAQPPEAIARRGMSAVARLALLALQTARDDAEFGRQLRLLARLYIEAQRTPSGEPSVALVLRYLFQLRERSELRELVTIVEPTGVESMERKVMSWAEEERLAGRQEGRQEGQKEGQKEGLTSGALTTRRQVVSQLASQRFGALANDQVALIAASDEATLDRAISRVLSAATFGALFSG
ncbi:MAG: hypothetical protein EXS13_14490 [Planctomycetes bacterium]|nr:hypothetical protein [Planctomycetota bacterium]